MFFIEDFSNVKDDGLNSTTNKLKINNVLYIRYLNDINTDL